MSTAWSATPRAHGPSVLSELMEVVRPEFRQDVFRPPLDNPVFFQGTCVVPACLTAVSFPAKGLCNRHYHRWKRARDIDFGAWLVEENTLTLAFLTVEACALSGCNRAVKGFGLCRRHESSWHNAGRPDLETWLSSAPYRPPRQGGGHEQVCLAPACERWTEGPSQDLCRAHYTRWIDRGRPEIEVFVDDLAWGANPSVDLRRLSRQPRLEFQFGLQLRNDQGDKHASVRALRGAVGILHRAGVTSLLAMTHDEWLAHVGPRNSFSAQALTFLLDTRFALALLRAGDDPWASQFPLVTWDLKVLGLNSHNVRRIYFTKVPLPWMREAIKRWARWRLSRGQAPSTVSAYVTYGSDLARYLSGAQLLSPSDVTREAIEGWMASARSRLSASQYAHAIVAVRCFLDECQRHEWARLPNGARLYSDDTPRAKSPNPRWIPEFLMAQIEDPKNLAKMSREDDRLLLEILINCGLRIGSVTTLPFGCVTRDQDGAPYLAWFNRKMHDRPAFFPIAEDLALAIGGQQGRVSERFPAGCPWLFPADQKNLNGAKPIGTSAFKARLERWLEDIGLRDEQGNTVKVTSHQFRHTVGTRLINADVPQHIVQQLLDHLSPEMTAIYARLHNKTIREHWERARKVDADGNEVVLGSDHPLRGAAWMRLSMVRAKVTLPNGYCGAPVQTDCEYANPCLDCQFFITTKDFLEQHRRQREETRCAIEEAQRTHVVRLVEKNTRTLGRLDRIIEVLEGTGPEQVVVGGKAVDVDAAS